MNQNVSSARFLSHTGMNCDKHVSNGSNPANIYLFKVKNGNTRKKV